MSEFVWRVAENGYAWAEDYREGRRGRSGGLISAGRLLVPRDLVHDVPDGEGAGFDGQNARGVRHREYHPFKTTGLFRDFANTEPTEAGIRCFADRYGRLGADGAVMMPPVRGKPLTENEFDGEEMVHSHYDIAQRVEIWREAIAGMKRAVALAERLPESRRGPVAKELQDLIQARLEVTGAVARFRLDPPPQWHPPLHVSPVNLHGAMWLQLARAVSENAAFRRCDQCGRWFEVSPKITRKSRKYCSEPCRTQAYRARIATAKQMRADGKSLAQIAEELGSDKETVRRWVDVDEVR